MKRMIDNTEIDSAVQAGIEENIVANPTLAGTEDSLSSIQIGTTKYAVGGGTEVVANPTLVGTETALSGLQVGDTKYSVGGDHLYVHHIYMAKDFTGANTFYAYFTFYSNSSTAVNSSNALGDILYNTFEARGLATAMNCSGMYIDTAASPLTTYPLVSIYCESFNFSTINAVYSKSTNRDFSTYNIAGFTVISDKVKQII